MNVTYSKMDYQRRGLIATMEMVSQRQMLGSFKRIAIDYEAEGYPQMAHRGQRRRFITGHHRGFVAPIPFEKAAILRKGTAGSQPQPLGIWRQDHRAELGRGMQLRAIRASYGVGRPTAKMPQVINGVSVFPPSIGPKYSASSVT